MNNLLQLKGKFEQSKGSFSGGPRNIPIGKEVTKDHVEELLAQITSIISYWNRESLISGAIVSVCYNSVVAKSNRIKSLLTIGTHDPDEDICGAKFRNAGQEKHVFTYYISKDALIETQSRLRKVLKIIDSDFNGRITHDQLEGISKNSIVYKHDELAKTVFVSIITDCYYTEEFTVQEASGTVSEQSIITLYKTDKSIEEIFKQVGIDYINAKTIDETTVLLSPDEVRLLTEKAPYLIAMSVIDLRDTIPEDVINADTGIVMIPKPFNEPTVGVIDTPFDVNAYFSDWVDYRPMIAEDIEIEQKDYNHGTEVTSIIVDGPTINPSLDDGCGRFQVRHFGVAKSEGFSSFSILKAIKNIVAANRDIKVWNLSLGSVFPIDHNFISPEAAELDRIQSEYDVVFIIAGTNIKKGEREHIPIGAPADSLNSVVVNSVKRNNTPASYYRVGPVLSFFHKPDFSYYGGDIGEEMRVCTPTGEAFVKGTSFAAPWITRKMAFLIYNLGFSREVAKALLVDAAANWNRQDDYTCAIGYGVVPIRIEDIVNSRDDEIKFFLTGTIDEYETYTYRLPVPIHNDKQPFYARATLCYFPKCVRNQGVDYTSTEMDIHFGRVVEQKGKAVIKSINNNTQGDLGGERLHEPDARRLYRKWDNIKVISEEIKDRAVPRKVYGAGMWGLSIKTKERLKEKNGKGLAFGVVVTLREMNGINRIEEFKKLCQMRAWIVNEINIENQLDVYNKAEEEIIF